MEQPDASKKRQFSVLLDEDQYEEIDQRAKTRRTGMAQVIREYVAAGIERDRRLERLADAAGV
jgi:hypothetical protein